MAAGDFKWHVSSKFEMGQPSGEEESIASAVVNSHKLPPLIPNYEERWAGSTLIEVYLKKFVYRMFVQGVKFWCSFFAEELISNSECGLHLGKSICFKIKC